MRPKKLKTKPLTDDQYSERVWRRTYLQIFKETKDPLALMRCFVVSVNLGIYPPPAIIRALAGAFQQVLDGDGQVTLDHAMTVRKKGQGAWNAFAAQKSRGLQLWLAVNMHSLIKEKGLTMFEAAEKVSRLCESLPDMKSYTEEGLMDQYSRKWKKQFQHELALTLTIKPL